MKVACTPFHLHCHTEDIGARQVKNFPVVVVTSQSHALTMKDNHHTGLQDSLSRDKEMYESMNDEVHMSLYQGG